MCAVFVCPLCPYHACYYICFSFETACLFADVSGFTKLSEAMASYGSEGPALVAKYVSLRLALQSIGMCAWCILLLHQCKRTVSMRVCDTIMNGWCELATRLAHGISTIRVRDYKSLLGSFECSSVKLQYGHLCIYAFASTRRRWS